MDLIFLMFLILLGVVFGLHLLYGLLRRVDIFAVLDLPFWTL